MRKRTVIIAVVILAFIFIMINIKTLTDLLIPEDIWQTQHTLYFRGYELHTRAPIPLIENISVYPKDVSLNLAFYNGNVTKIGLAFIPNDSVNGYYGVVMYSLAAKLPLIMKEKTGVVVEIEPLPVNSTGEARNYSSSSTPVILLLPPWMSNRTAVNVDDYFIQLEGQSFNTTSEYFDLDLSAERLLLGLMGRYTVGS